MRSLLVFLPLAFAAVSQAENGYVEVQGPPGIQIFLDGKLQGETDADAEGYIIQDVSPGSHRIKAEKEGFITQETQLDVGPGEIVVWRLKSLRRTSPNAEPEPAPGAPLQVGVLTVKSVPTACTFESADLDLEPLGKREPELTVAEVPVGTHLFLFKGMKKELTHAVQVRARETATVMVNFPRGTVTVSYAPTPPVEGRTLGDPTSGAYPGRKAKTLLEKEGGSDASEGAVAGALRWLRRAQSKNGQWDCDAWTDHGKHPPHRANLGDSRYDVGVTSLALLAFLGSGHTHRTGRYTETVARGLAWLRSRQSADGSIGFLSRGETIYNHALATQALCEAYGATRDIALRGAAERALAFCLKAQNLTLGWKYGVKPGRNDSSVTGWMVQALLAGKRAGFDVPDVAFAGALWWFDRATDSEGNVGYESPGAGSSLLPQNDGRFAIVPVMTGVSTASRLALGKDPRSDGLRQSLKHVQGSLPKWDPEATNKGPNFYYFYYGAQAMFQVGGSRWRKWNAHLQAALLPNQCTGGPEDGSWPPSGEWCIAGGRVYATALNALTLESYYRHERAR